MERVITPMKLPKPEPYPVSPIPEWAWRQIEREDAEEPALFKPTDVERQKVERVFGEIVRALYPRVTPRT